jgi:hypothetical protein
VIKLKIHKIQISDEEKAFLPLLVMKGMQGFDELNKVLEEKFSKKMLVKGEAKLKNFIFKTEDLVFEWKGDITEFKVWGTVSQYKKKFLGGEELVKFYKVSIDFLNKSFLVDPNKNKTEVLAAICLLIMESIKSVVKEVKKK